MSTTNTKPVPTAVIHIVISCLVSSLLVYAYFLHLGPTILDGVPKKSIVLGYGFAVVIWAMGMRGRMTLAQAWRVVAHLTSALYTFTCFFIVDLFDPFGPPLKMSGATIAIAVIAAFITLLMAASWSLFFIADDRSRTAA